MPLKASEGTLLPNSYTYEIWHVTQFYGSQSPIRLLGVSHCVVKSLIFYMVQPIDLIFCKMIEMIEQNIFNRANFYLGPNFLFLAR